MHADIPKSVAVGQPTPKFTISGAVLVNAADATALRRAFMKTVEATGVAQFRVEAPEGHKDFKVPLHAAKTNIPASGGFSVKVTGVAPSTSFSKSGKAKITVGDLDGHVTASGFITVDPHVQCKLTPGQNNVVASFDITGPRKTTGSATSGSSGISGTTTGPASSDRTGGSTRYARDAGSGGTAPDASITPSRSLAVTGSQGTKVPALLAGGTLVVGTFLVAAAFRFRSHGRRPGQRQSSTVRRTVDEARVSAVTDTGGRALRVRVGDSK
jgi:hypothetical protein